jgi:hypothetical protein
MLELVVSAAVLVWALFYQLKYYNCGLVLLDEGFLASLADRILHGEVIYRDFYTLAGPLPFYLVALLFKLFGLQLIVIRWMFVFATLGQVTLVLAICRRLAPWPFGIAAAVVVATWNWMLTAPSAHNWLPELLLLGGLFCGLMSLERRPIPWLFTAGVLCGLAAVCKTTTGNLAFLALVVAGSVIELASPAPGRMKRAVRSTLTLLSGMLLVVIPAGILLLATAGWDAIYLNLVETATKCYAPEAKVAYPAMYPATRTTDGYIAATWKAATGQLPYKDVHDLAVHVLAWAPVLAYVVGGLMLLMRLRRKSPNNFFFSRLSLVLVFAAFTHLQVFPRADVAHVAAAVVPGLMLGAILTGLLWQHVREKLRDGTPSLRIAAAGLLLVVLACPFAALAKAGATWTYYMYGYCDTPLQLQRARGIYLERLPAAELAALVEQIRNLTKPGERIIVLPSAAGIYFLADRRNATPYELTYNGPIGPCNIDDFRGTVDASLPRLVVYGLHDRVDGRDFQDYARPVYELIHQKRRLLGVTPNYELLFGDR